MGITDMKSGGKVVLWTLRWISVDERLPDENELYLVSCTELGKSDVRVMTYDVEADLWDRFEKYDKWDLFVTHWMPLPPSPTGG